MTTTNAITTPATDTAPAPATPFADVPAGGLPAPPYTNPAVAEAVARCRKDGGSLYRVTATLTKTGERFGYDLPYYDAKGIQRDLEFNVGYEDVTFERVR